MSDDDIENDEGEEAGDHAVERRRNTFSLLLIAGLAVWKVYQAIAADTVQATIAPSLYTLGLGSFAVSQLGPRTLRVTTFFVGAGLCLAAIAFDSNK